MGQLTNIDFREGSFLLIDKPLDWTSFDVVNKIRYRLRKFYQVKKIKVGHAGTLDPRATGLLVIATGKFTKKLDQVQGLYKEYTGTITLGISTPSYDSESLDDAENHPIEHITTNKIDIAKKKLTGVIQQQPPIFSAIRVDGERAYKLARRKGTEFEIPFREVTIYEFDITKIELPNIEFRIKCSKGTYIRSIAHDLGKLLETGGYLSKLRRTKIGDYDIKNAITIDNFIEEIDNLGMPPEQ